MYQFLSDYIDCRPPYSCLYRFDYYPEVNRWCQPCTLYVLSSFSWNLLVALVFVSVDSLWTSKAVLMIQITVLFNKSKIAQQINKCTMEIYTINHFRIYIFFYVAIAEYKMADSLSQKNDS